MGIRSQNNPIAAYLDVFSGTGSADAVGSSADIATPLGMTATGGVVSDYISDSGGVFRSHVFTSSGSFNVTAYSTSYPNTVEYLVVAGGGGGGGAATAGSYAAGGGGGAGGLRTNLSGHPLAGASLAISTSPGSYTVTIGSGGAGGSVVPAQGGSPGTNGGLSVFGTIQSDGGGYGGAPYNTNHLGNTGGSAGAPGTGPGGSNRSGVAGNTPPRSPSQGNDSGNTTYYASGGGGGAGAQGEDRPASGETLLGGAGGIGTQVLITASPAIIQPTGAPGPGSSTGSVSYTHLTLPTTPYV